MSSNKSIKPIQPPTSDRKNGVEGPLLPYGPPGSIQKFLTKQRAEQNRREGTDRQSRQVQREKERQKRQDEQQAKRHQAMEERRVKREEKERREAASRKAKDQKQMLDQRFALLFLMLQSKANRSDSQHK